MSSTPFIFRLLNPVMKAMLTSPLHGMLSDRIMVISFTGRKTGRVYSTPVSYVQDNGTVYSFTHAGWWVNLVGGAGVRLQIRGREYRGTATPIREDRERKIAALGALLKAVPGDARFFNVTIGPEGQMDPEELALAADDATMIEVRLEE